MRSRMCPRVSTPEIETGAMIVYTSADSVLQICGNEETFDLQNLYRCCEIARSVKVWKGLSVLMPIISQCPAMVSLALLASAMRM